MKHNAGRAGAFCRINPKLHPKPSEHPPGKGLGVGGGHKVKSTTSDPRESGSGEEVRQEAERGCQPLQPAIAGPAPSLLDFSQASIYYSVDLLKVISEPSGPAR